MAVKRYDSATSSWVTVAGVGAQGPAGANGSDGSAPLTTKGDLLTRSSTAVTRLGVGTNGQVLTADSAEATGLKWASVAAGGKVLQVVYADYSTAVSITTDSSYSDTGPSITITPTSSSSKIMILATQAAGIRRDATTGQGATFQLLRNSTTVFQQQTSAVSALFTRMGTGDSSQTIVSGFYPINYLDSPATTSATTYKIQGKVLYSSNTGTIYCQSESTKSTMLAIEIAG